MDLTKSSIKEIRDAVQTKKISAVEVTEFFSKRISTLDKQINAFISINEKAIDAAKKIDQQVQAGEKLGPLAGA